MKKMHLKILSGKWRPLCLVLRVLRVLGLFYLHHCCAVNSFILDWYCLHWLLPFRSCFPTTIITRVLMCGLKEFSRHGAAGPDGSVATDHKVPKMASVVGILGHLASRHGNDIRKALLVLFKVRHNALIPIFSIRMAQTPNQTIDLRWAY